jgi:hypothetical protein
MNTKVLKCALTATIICIFISGCFPPQHISDIAQRPVTVNVFFPKGAPSLNSVSELKCEITNSISSHNETEPINLSLDLELPDAFEIVSGNLSWTGPVPSLTTVETIDVKVRSLKTGQWVITAYLYGTSNRLDSPASKGTYPVYVEVKDKSARWGKVPPWATTSHSQEGSRGTIPITVTE